MSRLPHLGWSSNVYPLEAADVAALADYEGADIPDEALPKDDIILLIRPDGPDVLLRGRTRLHVACSESETPLVVPVRIVFKPSIAIWNLLATLFRPLRNLYRYQGTGIYHIDVHAVRDLGVERAVRTLDNVGRGHERKMTKLYTSLREQGYNEAKPINVMLCRTGGSKDSLRNGHHRISACLELGVSRMTIHFSAAGALPRCFWKPLGMGGGRS